MRIRKLDIIGAIWFLFISSFILWVMLQGNILAATMTMISGYAIYAIIEQIWRNPKVLDTNG